jgi:hypothetical protein
MVDAYGWPDYGPAANLFLAETLLLFSAGAKVAGIFPRKLKLTQFKRRRLDLTHNQ